MSALQQLHSMVGENENILWSGRPNFKCYILKSIFNLVLPFALVFGLGALSFPLSLTGAGPEQGVMNGPTSFSWALLVTLPITIFIAIPVWLYLGGVLLDFLSYRNIAFLITDKGFYCSSGILALNFKHKPFMEIAHVNLHRSIMDRMLGVGDVVFETPVSPLPLIKKKQKHLRKPRKEFSIYTILDFQAVYSLAKELQQHVYADVQYPNDLRPKENHGYNTSYIPPENKQ